MLSRLLTIGLIIALISANFSRLFTYAGFQANQSYIAKVLCENKSRPWMHCNGKCYLMKKLKQAEESEKKQAAKDNLNRLEVSCFQQPFQSTFIAPMVLNTMQHSFSVYTYQYSSRYIDSIFRPPRRIA